MISIIIPAYNAEHTVTRCLHSIFAQTYQDFEVIVVNDGSKDSTAQKVLDFAQTISQQTRDIYFSSGVKRSREVLQLISQENQGAQAARNNGFAEIRKRHPGRPQGAEGSLIHDITHVRHEHGVEISRYARNDDQFILFCDADVVLQKDCLEKMMHALEQNMEASYVYSSFKFGWKTFKLWPFDAERLRQMPYIHTTSLIRVEHFPGFDESVKRLQDWDLWLTMLEQGHIGVWIPEVLFSVVNTKGTMSQWIPSFLYKIPWKWLRIQSRAVTRYNEAVARIKAKHKPG